MAFPKPLYSKTDINRAGDFLKRTVDSSFDDLAWSDKVLTNWRGCHAYPINTFNTTLRKKAENIDPDAIVSQRLKRAESIITKLNRFDKMKLSRMQDIGGLRAILASIQDVRQLEKDFKISRFEHELITTKDYINEPKNDGYRGIHLVYRYKNRINTDYDGFQLELQLRTRLQHSWATAVETMGTYLGQALKSSEGDKEWLKFFEMTSSAFAFDEKSPRVPGCEHLSFEETISEVARMEAKLGVLQKLNGFSLATNAITSTTKEGRPTSFYHVVMLNMKDRSTLIYPYARGHLAEAISRYSELERRATSGESINAVLVSAGSVETLRRAYPNYFLDTQGFIDNVNRILSLKS